MALPSSYETQDANKKYRLYRKKIKKMGGKEVMTPGQFAKYGLKHYNNRNKDNTSRTNQIQQRLKVAGLTEEEIARLRK